MALYANVATFPPLNQISVLPGGTSHVDFTVLLLTHRERPHYPFIVRLHYSRIAAADTAPSQWASVELEEAVEDKTGAEDARGLVFVRTETEAGDESRRVFRGRVDVEEPGRMKFAVAYKIDQYAGWRWAEGPGGIAMGEVLVSAPAKRDSEESVRALLDMRDGWNVRPCGEGQAEGDEGAAAVFEVTSEDKISHVEDGTRAFGSPLPSKALGPVGGQVRWMSLVRLEPYWLGVQHSSSSGTGDAFYDQSMDGVLVLFLLESGQTLGLLAYGGEDVYTIIRSGADGEVVVAARNDSGKEIGYSLLLAVDNDHEGVVKAVMVEARKRAMDGSQMQKLLQRVEEVGNREDWASEAWFDGLAYCTWNGLDMHRCDEKAVLEGLETLDKNGVKCETFLLDDCWQSLGDHKIGAPGNEHAGWDRFEANSNFPRGLKALVDDVRSKHKNIKSFGVWQVSLPHSRCALFGYWGGFSSTGYIADNYKMRRIRTMIIGNRPSEIWIVDPSDIDRFYDDLYTWLKAQGVDFVKTDVQHMLSMLEDAKDREEVATAYQRAWTTAVCKHFQGKAISCMSQTPQTMFHSLLQDKTPKVMHRNSDDFFPDVTDSNPWHVFVNAHNALLDRHLNVIPDWDMFQTSHPFSAYHAAARALSGGPILITDIPGAHDPSLIHAMTAHTPSDTLIALRPSYPAAVSAPWNRYADGDLCRTATYAAYTSTADASRAAVLTSTFGVGLLGVFNPTETEKREVVAVREFAREKPAPIPYVDADGTVKSNTDDGMVVITSHRTSQVLGPLNQREGLVSVNVRGRAWDILCAAPVWEAILPLKHIDRDGVEASSQGARPVRNVRLAMLGLIDKMSGPAAVVSQRIVTEDVGDRNARVSVTLKALGTLALWVEGSGNNGGGEERGVVRVGSVEVDGRQLPAEYLEACEQGEKGEGTVYKVDVLRYWRDKELWSEAEELQVDMFLSL